MNVPLSPERLMQCEWRIRQMYVGLSDHEKGGHSDH